MSKFCILVSLIIILISCSNNEHKIGYEEKLINQRKFNESSFRGANSPLQEKDKADFTGLNYFDIDTNFRVKALIQWDLSCEPIRLVTDSTIESYHYPSAFLTFSLRGEKYKLQGFTRELQGIKKVFIPFYDETSGKETYGGGRFLDATLVSNEQLMLDFNLAYNPYCAYNPSYICAVPPFINDLKVEILAGEKLPLIDKH